MRAMQDVHTSVSYSGLSLSVWMSSILHTFIFKIISGVCFCLLFHPLDIFSPTVNAKYIVLSGCYIFSGCGGKKSTEILYLLTREKAV